MQRHTLRGRILAHCVTAVAVALVAIPLASGRLAQQPTSTQSHDLTATMAAQRSPEVAGQLSANQSTGHQETPSSSRGSRETDQSSASAVPTPILRSAVPASKAQATATPAAVQPPAPMPGGQGAPQPRLRVGIQAGHWKSSELPPELASLRGSTGAAGQGWAEIDVNLDIARRVVVFLAQHSILAELIPATVPPHYTADAFVALHCDNNSNTKLSGFKVARSSRSSIPQKDDALVHSLVTEYQAATGLAEHRPTITQAMLYYYAFANGPVAHSVAPTTPAAILEMVFLSNAADRQLIFEQPDTVAGGVARGILRFLGR